VYIRRRSRYPITLIIMKDVDAHLWTERMAMRFKKRGFPQLPRKKVANRSTARMIIESHDYRIGMESRILFYVFMLTARPRASFACNSRPHLRQRAAIAAFSDWLYWRLPFILFSALFVSQFATRRYADRTNLESDYRNEFSRYLRPANLTQQPKSNEELRIRIRMRIHILRIRRFLFGRSTSLVTVFTPFRKLMSPFFSRKQSL